MKINQKYNIKGMSCAACVANVTKAVSKVKGVKEVNVNLLTNSMVVTHDVDETKIINAVRNIGYDASLATSLEIKKDNDTKNKLIMLIISFILLIPLLRIFKNNFHSYSPFRDYIIYYYFIKNNSL